MTEELKAWLTSKHSVVILSQLSEDAVKRISKSEISHDNQPQCLERSWSTLIETRSLELEHDFLQVDYTSEADSRSTVLPANLYHASIPDTQAKVDIKAVMSNSTTTPWSNLGADSIMYPEVDMCLLEYMRTHNLDFGVIKFAVLNACLLRSGTVCFRHEGTDRWYIGMHDCSSMVISHPLKVTEMYKSKRKCFRPSLEDADRKLHPKFIINPLQIEAFNASYESPIESAFQEGWNSPDLSWHQTGLRIFPEDEPMDLLATCASQAFFDLSLPTLRSLAKEYYPGNLSNMSHFETLYGMCKVSLDWNEKRIMDILRKPIIRNMIYLDAYLDIEGAAELFTPEEQRDMENQSKKQADKKAAGEKYAREYEAARVRVFQPVAVTRDDPSHPLHGHPSDRRFHFPGSSEPSQAQAKLLLPPSGVSIWKGNPTRTKTGSWCAHYAPWPRFSRSWVAAGSEEQALKEVLQHVWRLWLKDRFLKIEDCSIQGLFD